MFKSPVYNVIPVPIEKIRNQTLTILMPWHLRK